MKNKKRSILLSFILLFSFVLTACSNSSSSEVGNSSDEEGGSSGDKVELVWMTRPPESEEQKRIREETIIQPFQEKYPNIKLKLVENPDPDALTRQQLAAGAGPDIIIVDGPTTLAQFASAGYMLPLDEYAKQYGWDERYYDWAYEAGKYQDKLYGLPGMYESLVVWYNKDLFEEKGWKEPKTFEEFMTLNETIQKDGIMPFAFGTTEFRPSNEWWLSVVYNSYLGKEEFKKVLSNEVPWTSDLVSEATQTWVDIWKKGYINDKQSHAISLEDAWYLFNNQEAAMKMEGTWALSRFATDPPPFNVDFFVMPGWRDGVEPTLPLALGENAGINAKTKNPNEVAAFLDFLYSKEKAEAELKEVGAFYPVNEIDVNSIEGLDDLTLKVYNELDKAMESGNAGYASWTYWPPSAQQYLWDNIDAVFLDQLSVEEYLKNAQSKAEKDEADGMLFNFSE